jgi:hypothetical protein
MNWSGGSLKGEAYSILVLLLLLPPKTILLVVVVVVVVCVCLCGRVGRGFLLLPPQVGVGRRKASMHARATRRRRTRRRTGAWRGVRLAAGSDGGLFILLLAVFVCVCVGVGV